MSRFEDTLAIYRAACEAAGLPLKGKNLIYTSDNGHMFSQMNKAGGLGLRLPKARQKELGETHSAGPFKSYGATMKDYVELTGDMLADTGFVADLLKESHAFVMALPPGNKK